MKLMTSLSEAHSVSLLEAMASRLPIVATNVGGNPEIVIHGQTGFLVEPRDIEGIYRAVIQLVQNPELRKKMGQAGFERVNSHFQQSSMHQQYLDIYHRLTEGESEK